MKQFISFVAVTSLPIFFMSTGFAQPPKHFAGPDRDIEFTDGDMITITGARAGEYSDLSWELIKQPRNSDVELLDPEFINPYFFPTVEGNYRFELTVTDEDGNSFSDVVKYTLTGSQAYVEIPRHFAGRDREVVFEAGDLVTITGASGVGIVDEYEWAVIKQPRGSDIEIEEPDTINPYFYPEVEGIYRFELTLTDVYGNEYTDVVKYILEEQ